MEDNRKKAVAFMLLSGLSFALMGAFVKLSGEIPVFEKVFFRNLISMLVAFALIRGKSGGGPVFGKRETFLIFFRARFWDCAELSVTLLQ